MKLNIKTMTTTALLAAVSIVVCYFEIPVAPAFPFLKLDFAQVPLILCAMLLGAGAGIFAQIINALIALVITGTASAGVGTAFNLVLGVVFVLLYSGMKKLFQRYRFHSWIALAISSLLTIVLACLLNYVAVVPIYKMIGMVPQSFDAAYFVIGGALPLNLIKWPVNAALAGVLYQVVRRYFR